MMAGARWPHALSCVPALLITVEQPSQGRLARGRREPDPLLANRDIWIERYYRPVSGRHDSPRAVVELSRVGVRFGTCEEPFVTRRFNSPREFDLPCTHSRRRCHCAAAVTIV